MTAEIWKPIPGFGGHYEASNLGNIRVKDRVIIKPHSQSGAPREYTYKGRQLRLFPDGKGYLFVHIGVDGKRTKLAAHRAVLLAFVGSPPPGCEACHCNGKSDDNRIENLRWDTHFSNNQDRLKHGTYAAGDRHPMNKYSIDDVRAIRDRVLPFKEARAKIGISCSQFYRIKRGQSWVDL